MCDCTPDKEIVVKGKYLTNGETKSCGCLNTERITKMGKSNKKFNTFNEDNGVVYVDFYNSTEKFLCDQTDWNRAKTICWHKTKAGYVRGEYNNKLVLFHNYILNGLIPEGCEVDHISGNKLDNRRDNLRICSRRENSFNKGLYSNNTSGVSGVSWHKGCQKWTAQIQKDKTLKHLGTYDCFEDAVRARNDAEKNMFGEYRRINAEVIS